MERTFTYMEAIEAKEVIETYLNDLVEKEGYSEIEVNGAKINLENAIGVVKDQWNKKRNLQDMLEKLKQNKQVEMNEDEYMSVREFLEMHDTPFSVVEVYYDYKYYVVEINA